MQSALYEGTISHRRFAVRTHEFDYRVAMAYVDLDEVDELAGGVLVRERPGIVRFRRPDYLGDPAVPLADAQCAPGRASETTVAFELRAPSDEKQHSHPHAVEGGAA